MALAELVSHARAAPSRSASRYRVTSSTLSLLVCAAGLVAVVLPALHGGDAHEPGRVSVQVLGRLSTIGLPEASPVSQLVVRNDGPTPLSWTARPTVTGPGAAAVVVESWIPSGGRCGSPTRLLGKADWSAAALRPGQSATLCARVRTIGSTSGEATPSLTIAARPA